jgi:hypothetical protein
MTSTHPTPKLLGWTQRLEQAAALDKPVRAVEPSIWSAFGAGTRGSILRGDWLGHAVHPMLTDVVLGTWTSAAVLDVFGGPESAAAAQRLVATGLLAFGPTAWTGWAQWLEAGPGGKRVGLVHALVNGVAFGAFAASWVARKRGRQRLGVRLGLVGTTVSGAGAYLGGHLSGHLSGPRKTAAA